MIQACRSEPVAVSRVGSVAYRIFGEARSGRIAAVFEHSCYVDFCGRFVCVGSEEIGNGPLNALAPAHWPIDWRAIGLRVGDSVVIEGTTVRISSRRALDFSNAQIWIPRPPPAIQDVAAVSANLEKLLATISASMPATGLAGLMLAPSQKARCDPLLKYVSRPYEDLKRWLAASLDADQRSAPSCARGVGLLVGAGPGLTPSGDDLLAGAMVTLHRLGERPTLARLARRIGAQFDRRTNAISAAHLTAAMDGLAAETIIMAIDELISRRTVAPEMIAQRINSVGATSGWDGLTGAVTVLECWLAGRVKHRRRAGQTRRAGGLVTNLRIMSYSPEIGQ